jgi:hypothetical protein
MDGRLTAMASAHRWMIEEGGLDMHTLTAEMLKRYSGDRCRLT